MNKITINAVAYAQIRDLLIWREHSPKCISDYVAESIEQQLQEIFNEAEPEIWVSFEFDDGVVYAYDEDDNKLMIVSE